MRSELCKKLSGTSGKYLDDLLSYISGGEYLIQQ